MLALVLDSGGVSRLAERNKNAAALISVFRRDGLWPPMVPSFVLVESLTADSGRDAKTNQFLKNCDVTEGLPVRLARRAALLRTLAGSGSAVDALVVASAEPNGTVLTSDVSHLTDLAAHSDGVKLERA